MKTRLPVVRLMLGNLFWVCLGSAAATAAQTGPSLRVDKLYGDGGVSNFYTLTTSPPKPHGLIIRTEPLESGKLPTGAGRGIRMLYSSTDGLDPGHMVAVSGQIFLPKSKPPTGGWPIVAWEHGTTGIADVCAPSWRGFLKRDQAYLNRWLSEGFAVVATDYQGLGTAGPHPYLLYRPEGYSALDAVKAALGFYPKLFRNRIVLVGQSQGSGAALGAAWLAPRYAPRLKIAGVVATGLIVDFHRPLHPVHQPLPVTYHDAANLTAAFAMLVVEGTDQSLHSKIDDRTVMTPAGIGLSHVARTACLGDVVKAADAAKVTTNDLFNSRLQSFDAARMAVSLIPNALIKFPVFAGTGLADVEASLPGQYNAVAAMCDAGTRVIWHEYPGLTHNGTVNGSLVDSVPFVKALMRGDAITGNCGSIMPPGAAQRPAPGVQFND